jgi:diguanylate cyclase (GGDEF)-like protein
VAHAAQWSGLQKAWNWLRSHWEEIDAPAPRAQSLKFQRYQATAHAVLYAELGNACAALFLFWQFKDAFPHPVPMLWLLTVLLVLTNSFYGAWRIALGRKELSVQYGKRVVAHAVIVAALFTVAGVDLFHRVNADGQLLIVALFVGMMCAGVIALNAIPCASLSWIVIFVIAGLGTLLRGHRHVYIYLTVLLVLYTVALVAWSLQLSKNFLERIRAKSSADEQRDVTGLLLRDFEGSARDWLWEADVYGRLQRVPQRLAEYLKRPQAELEKAVLTQTLSATLTTPMRDATLAYQALEQKLQRPVPFTDLIVPVSLGGDLHWWAFTARPLHDVRGAWVGWRGVGSDVTDAQRREQDLTRLANVDSLTGLASRHQFHTALNAFDLTDPEISTGLLLLDLDNFKAVNDTLGHATGDQLLHLVAQRLASVTSATDLLARLGGDEYALIVRGARDALEVVARGQAMLDALRAPFAISNVHIEVRGSVGAACAPVDASRADTLLQAADTALYAAKEGGRNTVFLFDRELAERTRSRTQMTQDLAQAILRDELAVHYQPQIDASSGALIGFEALVRWNRGHLGMIQPAEFIELAEETGLIVRIGVWVLRDACRTAVNWPDAAQVSVNLSASQFSSRSLLSDVAAALTDSGLPPDRLELEITESALIEDRIVARETLRALRAMGVHVALDDFGTGYSSLSYLGTFPLDRLKIDRSFVIALEYDPNGQALAIVQTIIQLARGLQLATTAEGVETAAQLRALRAQGCDAIQGYCVARPMPASEIPAFRTHWLQKIPQASAADTAKVG